MKCYLKSKVKGEQYEKERGAGDPDAGDHRNTGGREPGGFEVYIQLPDSCITEKQSSEVYCLAALLIGA